MPILTLEAARYLLRRNDDERPGAAQSMAPAAIASAGILQRNTIAPEVPDPRYWTAYDYYMIELEARAMRNAHLQAVLAKGWRAMQRRLFG